MSFTRADTQVYWFRNVNLLEIQTPAISLHETKTGGMIKKVGYEKNTLENIETKNQMPSTPIK